MTGPRPRLFSNGANACHNSAPNMSFRSNATAWPCKLSGKPKALSLAPKAKVRCAHSKWHGAFAPLPPVSRPSLPNSASTTVKRSKYLQRAGSGWLGQGLSGLAVLQIDYSAFSSGIISIPRGIESMAKSDAVLS